MVYRAVLSDTPSFQFDPAFLQDTQPSPLALLAATCSKIGAPSEVDNQGGQVQQQPLRFFGAGGQILQTGDVVGGGGGVIQLGNNLTMVDAAGRPVSLQGAGQPVMGAGGFSLATNPAAAGQVMPQLPQIVATPVTGPGGQIQYNLIPQAPPPPQQTFQTVTFQTADGQEQTLLIPSTNLASPGQVIPNVTAQAQPQTPTLIGPNGQIIKTQCMQSNVAQLPQAQNQTQMATVPIANVTPQGVVNLGAVPNFQNNQVKQTNNILQTMQMAQPQMQNLSIQVPVSVNGQTVYQTLQVLQPTHNLQSPGFQGQQGVMNLLPQQQALTLQNWQQQLAAATQETVPVVDIKPVASTQQPSVSGAGGAVSLQSVANSAAQQQQQQPTILNVPSVGASSIQAMIQNSQAMPTSSVTPLPTTTVAALPQTIVTPMQQVAGSQFGAGFPTAQVGAQGMQTIFIGNAGQMVQTMNGQTLQGLQNLQLLNQNGQLIQAPLMTSLGLPGQPQAVPVQNMSGIPGLTAVQPQQQQQIIGSGTTLQQVQTAQATQSRSTNQTPPAQLQLVSQVQNSQQTSVASQVQNIIAGQVIGEFII